MRYRRDDHQSAHTDDTPTGGVTCTEISRVTYAGARASTPHWADMDELSSAQSALSALRPVLSAITPDDCGLPTPCAGFDVAALGEHLVGTVRMVGAAADAGFVRFEVVSHDDDIEARVAASTEAVIAVWQRRGTAGEVVFAGRVMPARLALGVLSVELVVHGWDFAQALHRPLGITAAHADFVLAMARHIITPASRETAGFDDPVSVAADAAALDRLVAYTGRTPRRWPSNIKSR